MPAAPTQPFPDAFQAEPIQRRQSARLKRKASPPEDPQGANLTTSSKRRAQAVSISHPTDHGEQTGHVGVAKAASDADTAAKQTESMSTTSRMQPPHLARCAGKSVDRCSGPMTTGPLGPLPTGGVITAMEATSAEEEVGCDESSDDSDADLLEPGMVKVVGMKSPRTRAAAARRAVQDSLLLLDMQDKVQADLVMLTWKSITHRPGFVRGLAPNLHQS